MSGSGPQMRAQGLRGTAALVGFVALIVIAAMFGGCGLIGSPAESSNAANDTSAPATTFSESAVPSPPQPLPRGTATPTLPLPRPADVRQTDATEVSSAALKVMYTYDTTTDTTTQDAVLRTEPWMTPAYAATQHEHLTVAAPGLEWATWQEHRAYTVPTLEPVTEEAPSDTATAAYRQWLVTYKPVGRDGWQGEPVTVVAYVAMERAAASDPWRVSDVRVNSS